MVRQRPFEEVEFAHNPERRCPCVLLLDTSLSMRGKPIHELNRGLGAFFEDLLSNAFSAKRTEVAIVTFGGSVQTALDFSLVEGVDRPELVAQGLTPMGEAIHTALSMVRDRKDTYRRAGIPYYRPWIFLITDGAPTDAWREAAAAVHAGVVADGFLFFAVGTEGADFDVLRQISPTTPLELKDANFRSLFAWLSSSLETVAQSDPGTAVQLANPVSPDGWAVIPN